MRGFSWNRLIRSFKWFLISLPLVFLFYNLAGYSDYLDSFSSHIKHNKPVAAKIELDNLRDYWQSADRFMVGWLFKKRFSYEGAYAYSVGGFEGMERILDGEEDWLAHHMLGSAKFRLASRLYQAGKRGEDLDFLLDRSVYHFEQSLRNGPYSPNFFDQWNYDLASAARIYSRVRRRALGEKPQIIQVPFGFRDGEDGNEFPGLSFGDDDDGRIGRNLPLTKNPSAAGESASRKRRY